MITTYPKMNETIKDLLRRSDKPMDQYILARIEELEQQNREFLDYCRETCGACGFDFDCEYPVCGAHKWRKLWKTGENSGQPEQAEQQREVKTAL